MANFPCHRQDIRKVIDQPAGKPTKNQGNDNKETHIIIIVGIKLRTFTKILAGKFTCFSNFQLLGGSANIPYNPGARIFAGGSSGEIYNRRRESTKW